MKSIKCMLAGIALIAFGAFGLMCEGTWLAGVGLITPFLGLIFCIVGFFEFDNQLI